MGRSFMMSSMSDEQRRRIEENKKKALALRAKKQVSHKTDSSYVTHSQAVTSAKQPSFSRNAEILSVAEVPASLNRLPNKLQSWKSDDISDSNRQVTKSSSLPKCSPGNLKGTLPYQQKPAVPPMSNSCHTQSSFNSNPSATIHGHSSVSSNQPQPGKKYTSQQALRFILSSPKKAEAFKKAKVKGSCELISRTRFELNSGYSDALNSICKSMSTRQYDQQRKRWSFDLKEYTTFMDKAEELRGHVYLEPLPRSVIMTFHRSLAGEPNDRSIPEADLSCVDKALVDTLMPFQRIGVNFSIWRGGRVLIADDMGLGKTLQAITVASYYIMEWPLLIVVPTSVRFSWREQLLEWVPSLTPLDIQVITASKASNLRSKVVIISYDLMSKLSGALLSQGFDVIIMDESHCLKNLKTARTKAAQPLLKQAKRVILLSGTPALSRPIELFSQISVIDPRIFPKYLDFGVRYCNGKKNNWGWDLNGSSNLRELQLVLEEKIMIRRLKKDVLQELPAKRRQMVLLDPSKVKVNKSLEASSELVTKVKGMKRHGALLTYFHESGSAKLQAIKEYILDLLEAGHKFIVFAHHQEVLDAIEAVVDSKSRFIRIDGKTSSETRNVLVRQFQEEADVCVAILSITAANAGINLTAASLVVFAELFWNPGILQQAEDRAHRIGQVDSVNVHYLVAKGTVDDFVWPLIQQKLDVLGKAGLSKDSFSDADTKHMVNPLQSDIMKYLEESMIEDEVEANDQKETLPKQHMSSGKSSPTKPTPKGSQTTLFQFMKPSPKKGEVVSDTKQTLPCDRKQDIMPSALISNSSTCTSSKLDSRSSSKLAKSETRDQAVQEESHRRFQSLFSTFSKQALQNKTDSAEQENIENLWDDMDDDSDLWDCDVNIY